MTTPDGARVLLFAPHARLWLSYRMLMSLVESWAKMGAQVTVVGCDGLFRQLCPVMLASHVEPFAAESERASYCRECRGVASLAEEHLSLTFDQLDSYVTADMVRKVDETMAQVTQESWVSVEWDGIPFGRYASYLSMLTYKTQDVTSTPEAWSAYLIDLRNSLLTYLAAEQVASRYRPTHALVYDRLYPTHRAFLLAMRKQHIPVAGATVGSLIPRRSHSAVFHPYAHASQTLVDSTNARSALETSMTKEEIKDVSAQVSHLIAGNDPWVYSTRATHRTPKEVRETLDIKPESQVAVVLVGSPDETRSSLQVNAEFDRAQGAGVSDVVEFVTTCVAAARLVPDTHLVIRLHPRLAANKRERVTSPDLQAIQQVLSDLPTNVSINSPGDGIGLYDVMRIANVGVNHGSTSGLEFLAFGLPVIHVDPDRLNAYPPDLGRLVGRADPEGLARQLKAEAGSSVSLDRAVKAWRWMATVLLRISVQQQPVGSAESVQRSAELPPSQQRFSIRKRIPERWRESVARRMAWRALRQRIDLELVAVSRAHEPWVEESWRRFDEACQDSASSNPIDAASDHVWEPEVIVRGATHLDPDQERAAVEENLHDLMRLMGPMTGPGAGTLAALERG